MTMRRISVLLGAVVLAMMLSMGSALAHKTHWKVCDVRNGEDVTLIYHNFKDAKKRVNNTNDYWGECENGGSGNFWQNIARITAGR